MKKGLNNDRKSALKEESFNFALEIIGIYNNLIFEKKEYVLSKQLLKSGTSIGANIREAQNAESLADFIHKLHISQKECDETIYWLELLNRSEFISQNEFNLLFPKAEVLLKMLKSAILTSKRKFHKNNL